MSKCYFLAPTRDYPPDGPIRLGNIIASPSSPEEAINSNPPPPIIPPSLGPYEHLETDWKEVRERHLSGRGGIWASFLQGLGLSGHLGGSGSTSQRDEYKFERLTTCHFLPGTEYIEKSMREPDVQDFVVRNKFRKSVYMIIGIKVASGASVVSEAMKERGLNAQLSVDAMPHAVPVAVGPEVSFDRRVVKSVSSEVASDFVFAFRLRKIKFKKTREIVHNAYNRGALFSVDGGESSPRDDGEAAADEVEVEGLAEADASAADFGVASRDTFDDDGIDSCQCVYF